MFKKSFTMTHHRKNFLLKQVQNVISYSSGYPLITYGFGHDGCLQHFPGAGSNHVHTEGKVHAGHLQVKNKHVHIRFTLHINIK